MTRALLLSARRSPDAARSPSPGGAHGGRGLRAGRRAGRGGQPARNGRGRLMAAGRSELALDAYLRAAARDGFTVDTLAGARQRDLQLGHLGQAEALLRGGGRGRPLLRAGLEQPRGPPDGAGATTARPPRTFRRAYAEDSGGGDADPRQYFRLALARVQDPPLYRCQRGRRGPARRVRGREPPPCRARGRTALEAQRGRQCGNRYGWPSWPPRRSPAAARGTATPRSSGPSTTSPSVEDAGLTEMMMSVAEPRGGRRLLLPRRRDRPRAHRRPPRPRRVADPRRAAPPTAPPNGPASSPAPRRPTTTASPTPGR